LKVDAAGGPVRVLRIIARLNVGGPAYHVSLLSGRMPANRYRTLLVAGNVGRGEASFAALAQRYGAELRTLDSLGPELDLRRDLRALRELVRLMRGFRPQIVHTHTAKAGTLGRVAARIALGRRVVVIHTYHGHVLSGYFGPLKNALFRSIERVLGLLSDRLVAVSQATAEDLVQMRIAPRSKFEVIPLGLDLESFLAVEPGSGSSFRAAVGAGPNDCLALFVGRLVPIKRVDLALRAVAEARSRGARLKLAVVGDGELRLALESLARELGLDGAVSFLGFRDDLERLVEGADVALLTSDNEGTPVALIEASAGGRPSVATAVGGVGDVVTPSTGRLTPAGQPSRIADELTDLARDPGLRARLGAAAREHVRASYSSKRLIDDIDRLYGALLSERAV
jgi:glycosyltransferase involved in cell wall biosynthesis